MLCSDTHALQWRWKCQLPASHSDTLECANSLVPDREEERWVWCKERGEKKDEGVKKQAVCDVETSGWKIQCQSIWGRRERYNAEAMGGQKKKGGGIICVCLSAQWIIRKWTSGFRPPTVTLTAPKQYKFSWLKWCHINIIHQYIRYHSKQTATSQIFRSQ